MRQRDGLSHGRWEMWSRPLRAHVAAFALVALAVTLFGTPRYVQGQTVRGWAGSTVQFVGLRPLEKQGDEYRFGEDERAIAGTQDVSLTAWGFGVRGLSATTYLRGRSRLGSDFAWPRSGDDFDALLAYAQWVDGRLRLRAGRQEIRSGLGFSSFDGGSAAFIGRHARVEAYGGRSLARGLRDPESEALRGIEDFLPDQSVDLFGGAASLRVWGAAVTARYQREILRDRSGLASERGSLDFSTAWQNLFVTGSLDYDFAFARVGKGQLTLARSFSEGRTRVEVSAVRYVPYFSLSTIWGFFEPVGYSEGVVRVAWSGNDRVGAWLSGGLRRYEEAGTETVLRPLEDVGRRVSAGGLWRPSGALSADVSYRLEWGPGGFLNSLDLATTWSQSEDFSLTAHGTSFQQIDQFRLGDGRAVGGGISADVGLTDRMRLSGGGSVLRHTGESSGSASPWSQSRAWTRLRVSIGRDPGRLAGTR